MRLVFAIPLLAALAVLIGGSLTGEAKADPYRWCAEYGGSRGGGTNCYFMTLGQCRAAISGNGGFCRPNTFYTGDDRPRRRGPHSYY
jgi:hypothetical protein